MKIILHCFIIGFALIGCLYFLWVLFTSDLNLYPWQDIDKENYLVIELTNNNVLIYKQHYIKIPKDDEVLKYTQPAKGNNKQGLPVKGWELIMWKQKF